MWVRGRARARQSSDRGGWKRRKERKRRAGPIRTQPPDGTETHPELELGLLSLVWEIPQVESQVPTSAREVVALHLSSMASSCLRTSVLANPRSKFSVQLSYCPRRPNPPSSSSSRHQRSLSGCCCRCASGYPIHVIHSRPLFPMICQGSLRAVEPPGLTGTGVECDSRHSYARPHDLQYVPRKRIGTKQRLRKQGRWK